MKKYEVKYRDVGSNFLDNQLRPFLNRIGGSLNKFEFTAIYQGKSSGGKVQQTKKEEASTVIQVPESQVQTLDELRRMDGVISVKPYNGD